jgi:chromosome segregation and condensation protein ScpB
MVMDHLQRLMGRDAVLAADPKRPTTAHTGKEFLDETRLPTEKFIPAKIMLLTSAM